MGVIFPAEREARRLAAVEGSTVMTEAGGGDVHGFELGVCFGEHGSVAFYYPLLPVSLQF